MCRCGDSRAASERHASLLRLDTGSTRPFEPMLGDPVKLARVLWWYWILTSDRTKSPPPMIRCSRHFSKKVWECRFSHPNDLLVGWVKYDVVER